MKPRKARPERFNDEARRHLDAAQAFERAGSLFEAVAACRQAARAQPRSASIHTKLGALLRDSGEIAPALEALQRAAKLDPRSGAPHVELGLLYAGLGRRDEALESYTRAVWLDRRSVFARIGLADVHERSGDVDAAIAQIDDALALDPAQPYARIFRARLLTRRGDVDESRALLESILAEATDDQIRYRAAFELAKALDRAGEHDDAFAAMITANEAHARTPGFRAVDPAPWLHHVEQAGTLGAEIFRRAAARRPAPDADRPAPVFLIGFPRSGTTLTEQLLSAHPAIAVTNEADLLTPVTGALFAGLDQTRPLAELLADIGDDRIAAARAAYRAAAETHLRAAPGATTLVDKHPMNLVSLGLLNVVFPEARVIHALRDPRDVCLSCLFQEFVPNAANVHFGSPDRTLELYRTIMDLFLRQRDVLTVDILECRYEDTVADVEAQARRLLEFIGLPWNACVLDFYAPEHRRHVGTPSYGAVTAPVHARAVGRWKRYRARLAPMLEGLSPYIEAFGYSAT